MSNEHPHTAMAKAFRETALSLIGLYQIYEVHPDLCAATAEAIGTVFRRHLLQVPAGGTGIGHSPLHKLVDELDRASGGSCRGDEQQRLGSRAAPERVSPVRG
jgi:hypothetical protein